MRLLLTGCSGKVGQVLAEGLPDTYDLVGLDLVEPSYDFRGTFRRGDASEPEVVAPLVADTDAVVHLAGLPTEDNLDELLRTQVRSTAVVLDAMQQHRLTRFVYASSNHAVGMVEHPTDGSSIGTDIPGRPDTFYGVSKVAAEALMSLYADRYGFTTVAVRIGSQIPTPDCRRNLATWLSPGDCVRLFTAALEADVTGHHVVYGISANRDRWWSLDNALGYEPRDDAAASADRIPQRQHDDADDARVGGPFCRPDEDRRPFDPPEVR